MTPGFPYWTVQGRRFDNRTLANAYAFRVSHEQGKPVPLMEKLDDLTPAYSIPIEHPNPVKN